MTPAQRYNTISRFETPRRPWWGCPGAIAALYLAAGFILGSIFQSAHPWILP